MTLVDGRAIADGIFNSVKAEVMSLGRVPKLTAITCAPNFETKHYLALKKRKAELVGIELVVVELPQHTTTQELISTIEEIAPGTDGIVLQLPIPQGHETDTILSHIPTQQDPDGFTYGVSLEACLPPVVGAIVAIADHYNLSFLGKQVVVLGQGRLVGAPMATYLTSLGVTPTVFAKYSPEQVEALKTADIIVTGIGQPQYLTPDMVKEGVVIFDAGTSEDGGELRGDAHPDVALKASLFTPVPGGVGPVTIAVLLQNLVSLVRQWN